MKKLIILTICTALSVVSLSAQNPGEGLRQSDAAIKSLATNLAGKLTDAKVETVALGQFTYMGSTNQFSIYLNNQLTSELLDVRGSSFSLVSGSGAQCVITGEIIHVDNFMQIRTIRIYARIVRREGNALISQVQADFEISPAVSAMLSSGNSSDGGSFVMADEWESDSWDAPVEYSTDASPLNRTISGGDHDWFVIEPTTASGLVIETTGDMDTYMSLYDADTREELSSNDDSNGSNAAIRYFVRPGKKYMVEVRGYSDDTTGNYGFRAYAEEMGEPTPYEMGDINSSRYVMQRLGGGRDLFLLTPASNGTMVMETTGSIDLLMELYDAETYEMLASDDDGGYDNNSRIVHEVQRGRSYIARVRGYGSSDDQGEYGFKAYMDDLRSTQSSDVMLASPM
jgi:hypothetical protein